MKLLHILLFTCCVISSSLAKPPSSVINYQDSLGQYSFGYNTGTSARAEMRNDKGEIRRSYSYIDDKNVIQSAQYTADNENGLKITVANLPAVPLPVKDTPEVVAAQIAHFQEPTKVSNDKTEGEIKIGQNNIFLTDSRTEEEEPVKSKGKIEEQIIQKLQKRSLIESEPQYGTIPKAYLEQLAKMSNDKTKKVIKIDQDTFFLVFIEDEKPVESEGKIESEPQNAKEVIQNDEEANSQENSKSVADYLALFGDPKPSPNSKLRDDKNWVWFL